MDYPKLDTLELRSSLIVSPVLISVLAEVLIEVVGSAVHGKPTARKQFPRHYRGIGITKICHHVRLSIQLVGPKSIFNFSLDNRTSTKSERGTRRGFDRVIILTTVRI